MADVRIEPVALDATGSRQISSRTRSSSSRPPGTRRRTPRTARKAVASADPNAVRVWQQAVDALANALVTALTLLDPRTLVIGRGLAEAGEVCSHRYGTPSGSG